VKINIHEQLWSWRQKLMSEGYGGVAKKTSMKLMAGVLSHPSVYKLSGKIGRGVMRLMPWSVNNKLNPWYKQRDLPEPPKESFNDWYKKKTGSMTSREKILKEIAQNKPAEIPLPPKFNAGISTGGLVEKYLGSAARYRRFRSCGE
jgi:hypothetical protein